MSRFPLCLLILILVFTILFCSGTNCLAQGPGIKPAPECKHIVTGNASWLSDMGVQK
jgi:hypothetical protein